MTTFYDTLQIPRDASFVDIKKAYKRLAKQYHPDKNPHPDAKATFQTLSEAFSVLSDPDTRRRYDAGEDISLEHFDLDSFLAEWLEEMLIDDGMVDDMMASEFPRDCDELREQFLEEHVVCTTQDGVSYYSCKLCQGNGTAEALRSLSKMESHVENEHLAEYDDWTTHQLNSMKASFASFMREGLGFGDGNGFIMPDGSRADGKVAREKVPDIRGLIERQLKEEIPDGELPAFERLMAGEGMDIEGLLQGGGMDPEGLLEGGGMELEALLEGMGRDLQGPLASAGMNIEGLLKGGGMHRRRPCNEPEYDDKDDIALGCLCGYSCGTESAFQKHVLRFPHDIAKHQATRTRGDGVLLERFACPCGFSTTVSDALDQHRNNCAKT